MEQFNRVEIQGVVGNVRIANFEDSAIANISVATNFMYKIRDGQANLETVWFNVVARPGKGIESLDSISKGNYVKVLGRMRTRNYTDNEGVEHTIYEVIASKVEKVEE